MIFSVLDYLGDINDSIPNQLNEFIDIKKNLQAIKIIKFFNIVFIISKQPKVTQFCIC